MNNRKYTLNRNGSRHIQLSPTSLNLFYDCPLCFWLEKREKIRRPPPYPYALNSAVDILLKQEFDSYRAKGKLHPLLVENNIQAKLFRDQNELNQWRSNFEGIRFFDPELEATLFGVVDDVLEFPDGKLAVLDYKSTGSSVARVYDRFQVQMDVYSYLLEKNGFLTTGKGYLAFYIVDKKNGFGDRLPFRKELHEIETDTSYVQGLFEEAVTLLRKSTPPVHHQDCKFGIWFGQVAKF
ncbi:PD-(D/E)XK nuclease family protein [Patescibacteria group bacterium]|nr:PD-(D/E)XK nuclease family protein [Patescibacteria group bacterium]